MLPQEPSSIRFPITVDPQGRVVVADFGHSRVLIWNSIPARMGAGRHRGWPADVEELQELQRTDGKQFREVCSPGLDAARKGRYFRRFAKRL